jgi:oxygen-independent coproporphyrinogen-3 oxidase
MAGLYLHFPFCRTKCHYCDFYSVAGGGDVPGFLSCLEREMRLRAGMLAGERIDTVYFGGGTPSLMAPETIRRFLDEARSLFSFSDEPEITLEANPNTLTAGRLDGFRLAGINRISIGVQSFHRLELALLGRSHTSGEAESALTVARQTGFNSVGLDLIYGLPGQTSTTWEANLERAMSFDPDHISAYALTLSPASRMGRWVQSGTFPKPDEELAAELFLVTSSVLTRHGYEQYEVSNFAKPGMRSRHNESYWTGSPYLGLGPSAHSFIGNMRCWNVSDLKRYRAALDMNKPPVEEEETLTHDQRFLESVALGLRRREGVPVRLLPDKVGPMLELVESGHGIISGDRFGLTTKGMLMADAVSERLV